MLKKLHMVIQMLHIHFHQITQSHAAPLIMRSGAGERLNGQTIENIAGKQAIFGKYIRGHNRIKLVVEKPGGKGTFIESDEGWIVFRKTLANLGSRSMMEPELSIRSASLIVLALGDALAVCSRSISFLM